MNKFLMLLATLGFIGAVHAEGGAVNENESSENAPPIQEGVAFEGEADAHVADVPMVDEGASHEGEADAPMVHEGASYESEDGEEDGSEVAPY